MGGVCAVVERLDEAEGVVKGDHDGGGCVVGGGDGGGWDCGVNHGGRQLDGVPATLEVLPEIAEAVKGRVPIVFDGGIAQGSDVFKALALGADLCLFSRSALWGLAYKGQEGVEEVLHLLERDLWSTMVLVGARSVKDISRDMLGVARKDGFGIAKL